MSEIEYLNGIITGYKEKVGSTKVIKDGNGYHDFGTVYVQIDMLFIIAANILKDYSVKSLKNPFNDDTLFSLEIKINDMANSINHLSHLMAKKDLINSKHISDARYTFEELFYF